MRNEYRLSEEIEVYRPRRRRMGHYSFYPNRTLCSVLEEMRTCNKTRNFAALEALIEEAQGMGNRMEDGLGDKKEVKNRERHLAELKVEIKKLEAKRDKKAEKVKEKEKL